MTASSEQAANQTYAFAHAGPDSASAGALDCETCYLTWDHLGSTRLVTDAAGNVVARHDFLPFGEEIPSGYAGRDEQWGATGDNVNQKFTAMERMPKTASTSSRPGTTEHPSGAS